MPERIVRQTTWFDWLLAIPMIVWSNLAVYMIVVYGRVPGGWLDALCLVGIAGLIAIYIRAR
jgi:hypothetical protein